MTTTLLKKADFFRHLDQPELVRILSIAKKAKFAKNEIILSKEEVGNSFFIVSSGQVKIFTPTAPNRSKTLAYLGTGDFFGEMALLGGKVRSASAQAVTDCELLVINKANFRKLLLSDPNFTMRMLYTLSERLRKANREIEAFLSHNILGRLACAVAEIAEQKANIHKTPITVPISLHDLAEYIGTTREPLSRALSTLKRAGVLDYCQKSIIIKDYARLRSIAPDCL